MNAHFRESWPMPKKLRKRTLQSIGDRLESVKVIVMVDGATPTLTSSHSDSEARLSDNAMASLIVSIPPGLSTYIEKEESSYILVVETIELSLKLLQLRR